MKAKSFVTPAFAFASTLTLASLDVFGAESDLNFTATEIPLPEFIDSEIQDFGMTRRGDVFVIFNNRTAYKPVEDPWSLGPENFIVHYMSETARTVGVTYPNGYAGYWKPLFVGPNPVTTIFGNSVRYIPRGLELSGKALLEAPADENEESLVYNEGETTPFSDLSFDFDTTNLFPKFLHLNGSFSGFQKTENNSYHPFLILENELTIDEETELSDSQVNNFLHASENGHFLLRGPAFSSVVFGPKIDGIETVDTFIANSVDDSGYLLGYSPAEGSETPQTASIWTPASGLLNLNDLVSTEHPLIDAKDIQNDSSLLALAAVTGPEDQVEYHLYYIQRVNTTNTPQIDVDIEPDGNNLKIIACPNFAPEEIKIQIRNENGEWSDYANEYTIPTENVFHFLINPPDEQYLLRATATQSLPQ